MVNNLPEFENSIISPQTTKPFFLTIPQANHTYIILDVARGLLITLLNGKLLAECNPQSGGYKWVCFENTPFSLFGFYKSASGKYIGRDYKKELIAEAKSQKYRESFRLVPHPKGYVLGIENWWDSWRVSIKEGGTIEMSVVFWEGGGDNLGVY